MRKTFLTPLALSVTLCAGLVGCSDDSTNSVTYKYNGSNATLPTFREDWDELQDLSDTNLKCETNLIDAVEHEFDGNEITSTTEYKAALKAANYEVNENEDRSSDAILFYIAPDVPHSEESSSLPLDVVVSLVSGKKYVWSSKFPGPRPDYTMELRDSDNKLIEDVSVTDTGQSSSRGRVGIPVPKGIVSDSDPLKSVEISVNGVPLGKCGSAMGPDFSPEQNNQGASTANSAGSLINPDDWESLTDMQYDLHSIMNECDVVSAKPDNGVYDCGGTDVAYAMNTVKNELATEVLLHRAIYKEELLGSVALHDDSWVILCYGDNSVNTCDQIMTKLTPVHNLQITEDILPDLRKGTTPEEPLASQPDTTFGDGTHLVGTDIEPGTYRNDGSSACYWERVSGFSGTTADIIANDNPRGQSFVTIDPTDKGFTSQRCGEWEKVED